MGLGKISFYTFENGSQNPESQYRLTGICVQENFILRLYYGVLVSVIAIEHDVSSANVIVSSQPKPLSG